MSRDPILFGADAPFARVAIHGDSSVFEGQEQWRAPDGTCWEWTGAALKVATSRFGFCPFYYYQDERMLALSPSLIRLAQLGAPLALDHDALAVFIRLGFFLEGQTPFKALRQAAPGQSIEWPAGRLQSAFTVAHRPLERMSRAAAIDRYGEAFRAAMRKLLPPGDIILPLSGGRDSRHILFEMIEAGRKPHAVTLPRWAPDIDDDMAIARMLTARLGLRHSLPSAAWAKNRAQRRAAMLTDFCSDELAWMLPMRRFVEGHAGVVFDGIAGDILSNGLYLNPDLLAGMGAGNTAEMAELLLGMEEVWRGVLDEAFYKSLARERAVALLRKELDKHVGAQNPVSSYLFWNRTRREMSLLGFKILRDVRMPYIDDDVYDHLASLPAAHFLGKTFHTETIHRMFPQHADIPFDSKRSSRLRRWQFRASSLGAVAHLMRSRSKWVRLNSSFLNLRTKPADVGRVLCLLELEAFLRRQSAGQPSAGGGAR